MPTVSELEQYIDRKIEDLNSLDSYEHPEVHDLNGGFTDAAMRQVAMAAALFAASGQSKVKQIAKPQRSPLPGAV